MKTIDRYLGIALIGLAFGSLAACTDHEEWDVDSSYGRLFGATEDGISVTAAETSATVEFSAPQPKESDAGNIYYIIEVSKDSLYDEVAMGGERATVYGEDKSITKSPFEITGLDGDTEYFLRIKVMSDTKGDSKWAYYDEGAHFKTDAEQIFAEVTADDYTDSQVTLSWTDPNVTHIAVSVDGAEIEGSPFNLTDEEKANQSKTFTGLNQLTNYTFVIYNGEAKRGTRTVTTAAAPPAAAYTRYLETTETRLNQALFDQIVADARTETGEQNVSITIVFPAGSTTEIIGDDTAADPGTLKISDGVSVNFFGRGGGETPTLKLLKNFDIAGSHNFITFEHLNIVDGGAGYCINQSTACSVSEVKFTDCNVSGQATAFFRLQKDGAKVINALTIDNCVMHDMCSGYSYIHVDANSGDGVVKNINISNSTFYNVAPSGKMFIYSKKTNMESINITNCTFNNNTGSGNYFIDFNDDAYGPSGDFNITNCVFGKSADDNTKNIRASKDPNVVNSFCTSDFYKQKGFPGINELDYTYDKLFVAPDEADFHFQKGTLEDYKTGDPRWW